MGPPVDAIFFDDQDEFREWLLENHDRETELWVGMYKKNSGRIGIVHGEAVDQGLCFGWIDGRVRSLGEISYAIRFTPRKPNSIWSQVNIKRVGELIELGMMHPSGLATFTGRRPDREKIYTYEMDPTDLTDEYKETLQANEAAWTFFSEQAPSYQRTARHWIMSAKQEKTRVKRLNDLIESSANGKRLPQFVSPGTRKRE
ncbi:MAG: YdeI/OmpD-associated family protein [Nitrolancea sp.]